MLSQEKIAQFNQLLANGQAPAPEDSSDFEMYKALINSQALAANSAAAPVAQATTVAPVAPVVPVNIPAAAPTPSAVTPSNGRNFSMDDLMSSAMVVDRYLKVKFGQMFIGDDIIGSDSIYVSIDLDSVVAKISIKGGNPVRYAATVDGKTCVQGGSWFEAVSDIQKIAPNARPYNCVDLPMKIAKDITAYNGSVICPAGETVGHTTSTTNWKEWLSFYRSLPDQHGVVFAKVTRKDVKKNNNQWGLLEFTYIPNDEALAQGLTA